MNARPAGKAEGGATDDRGAVRAAIRGGTGVHFTGREGKAPDRADPEASRDAPVRTRLARAAGPVSSGRRKASGAEHQSEKAVVNGVGRDRGLRKITGRI